MAWIALIVAGFPEIVWAIALKHADGFSRLRPTMLVIASASASFVLLASALRSLPVGTAYAVRVGVGVGALGVTAAGIFLFDAGPVAEPLSVDAADLQPPRLVEQVAVRAVPLFSGTCRRLGDVIRS